MFKAMGITIGIIMGIEVGSLLAGITEAWLERKLDSKNFPVSQEDNNLGVYGPLSESVQ